jgi:uncharacterized protein YcnI
MIVALAIVAGSVCVLAAPAFAHVSIDPSSVPKGSTSTLSFIVPNERDAATTIELKIFFPAPPNAIANVSVEAKPGWKTTVTTQHLAKPIVTDDGSISEIVSAIDWKATTGASAIKAGEFGSFTINADGLPKNTDQLVFKAVQTYSSGEPERWVDPVTPNGPAAEHPTPILLLTNPDAANTGTTPTTAAPVTNKTTIIAASTKDNSARALAVVGVVLGAIALVFATAALMRRRRVS